MRASVRVRKVCRRTYSTLSTLLNASLTALSKQDPTLPIDCTTQLVFDHIDRYGETSARRLFTGRLVDQVQQVARPGRLNLGYNPWGQA